MRRFALLVAACLALFFVVTDAAAAKEQDPPSLQEWVDRAEAGETLAIPAGTYRGPVVIDKPLRLRAEGKVVLLNESDEPAIAVTADRVLIENLEIRTSSYGIQFTGANEGEIVGNTILRHAPEGRAKRMSEMRNGIDLYNSHHNRIVGNRVADMYDAIYVESSNDNLIENNHVERSRYGIHLMYSERIAVRDNIGLFNITGAMIMAVRDVETSGNVFRKQNENVHSQGILLFDAHASRFLDNLVEGNRVGFYIEQSTDNTFLRNRIRQNFIGAQFIEATGNHFADNLFVGNVTDAETRASADNRLAGNFWDAFGGIDYDGDGQSDIAYAINPFFHQLTHNQPAFQLFFHSPGMMFLEGLFQSGPSGRMRDEAPLMKPPEFAQADGNQGAAPGAGTAVAGILLLAASITMMYRGVRRT